MLVIVALDERFGERLWKSGHVHRGRQSTTGDFPESRLREVLFPEGLPARDGPPIGAEEPGEFRDSARRGSLPHGGDEDDDGTEINLPAEKPHRRRRDSLAAPVTITAEAQPTLVWFGQMVGTAGLSGVIRTVQSPTTGAGSLAGSFREVLVNGKKKLPEAGIARQTM